MKAFKFFKMLILFGILLSVIISCGGSSGSGLQKDNETSFKTTLSSEELSDKYQNFPIYGTLRVKFSEELSYEPNNDSFKTDKKDNVLENEDLMEISNNKKFIVYLDNKSIDGKLFISSERDELIFVPTEFLKPNTTYKVLISTRIKSIKNENLRKFVSFYFKTNSIIDVATLSVPSYAVRNKSVDMSLTSKFDILHTEWDMFYESTEDEIIKDVNDLTYRYENPGIYTIRVIITDVYGRKYVVQKELTVLQTSEDYLRELNNNKIKNIVHADINQIEDNELKSALERYEQYVLSLTFSTHTIDENTDELVFLSFTMVTDFINEFKEFYIKKLIDSNSFLGVVSLSGFPAIISYENIGEDRYKLKILVDDYGLIINNFNYGGYSINIEHPYVTKTPVFHYVSFEADNITLNDFKEHLPVQIDGRLPVLGFDNDELVIVAYEKNNKLGHKWSVAKTNNSTKNSGYNTTNNINPILHHIGNFISKDLLNALLQTKNFLIKFLQMRPDVSISNFNDLGNSIKDTSNQLRLNIPVQHSQHQYTIPSGPIIFNSAQKNNSKNLVTDMDDFLEQAKNYLSSSTEMSLTKFVNFIIDKLNNSGQFITNIFDIFKSGYDNYNGFINELVGNDDKNKSLYFYKNNKQSSLSIKIGASLHTVSLEIISDLVKYGSFALHLDSDFPLNSLHDTLDFIEGHVPSGTLVGLYYTPFMNAFSFIAKTGARNQMKCSYDPYSEKCLGLYLYKEENNIDYKAGVKGEIRINDNTTNYTLINFGSSYASGELSEKFKNSISEATDFVESLASLIEIFPELTITLVADKNRSEIKLTPNLLFLASLECSVGFKYAYLGGGGISGGLGLSIGVNIVELIKAEENTEEIISKLMEVINESYNKAMDEFSGVQRVFIKGEENENTINLVFNTSKDIIEFVEFLLKEIKSLAYDKNIGHVTDSIIMRMELGMGVALSIGAGGTGTGGASADIPIGVTFELESDLTAFTQLFTNMLLFGVESFPLSQIMESNDFIGVSKLQLSEGQLFTKLITTFKNFIFEYVKKGKEKSEEALKESMETFAEHFEIGIVPHIGVSGSAEEVIKGAASMNLAYKLIFNGEILLNAIYKIFNNDVLHNEWLKDYLYHEHIDPELKGKVSIGASVEIGVSEVIEAGVKAGVSTILCDWGLYFDFNIDGNNSYNTITVIIDADKKNIKTSDNVTLNCLVNMSNDTTQYETSWYISGIKVENEGIFNINKNNAINVETIENNKLVLSGLSKNTYPIACYVEAKNYIDILGTRIYKVYKAFDIYELIVDE